MLTSQQLNRSLKELKSRLAYVNKAWTVDNYEKLLRFYVHICPRLLHAERCSVFIVEPASGKIVSKVGTALNESVIEAPSQGSVVGRAISSGLVVVENDVHDIPGFHREVDQATGFATRNLICAPIRGVAGERVIGAIEVLNKDNGDIFSQTDSELLQEIAEFLSMALDSIVLNREMHRLSADLDRQVTLMQSDYLGDTPFIADSEAMRHVVGLVKMVCDTPVNVLIQGENGTGKEVIARLIHEGRDRRMKPFVPVNCAAIPEQLMESEFFGYEKGAFTGATSTRRGRFEEADGGTLFLDEVGDVPLIMQPKFLRAIQEGEGTRLGSNQIRQYTMSVISASNKNIRELVDTGDFRQDLFYRLFAVEIVVPPLRERREDIATLTSAFVDDVCRQYTKEMGAISEDLIALFESYDWPGNVRQLRREIERLVALTPSGQALTPDRCSPELLAATPVPSNHETNYGLNLPAQVQALEKQLIESALNRSDGHKGQASELLCITRQGLHKKLKRLGLYQNH